MSKIIAYIRTSTDNQDLSHQKLEILEFAKKQNLRIDDFVEMTISSLETSRKRRVDDLLSLLAETDTLVVTELSRLGRSTTEVITLINELINRYVRIIVIKQEMDIRKQDIQSKVMVTLFSLFAELERDLISLRTKEALASKKAQSQLLGKPKGTLQRSKFDAQLPKIKELLGYGLSIRKLAKVLGCNGHVALNTYIKKRGIKELVLI
jgi:DNA invertase Pin-like site-specific DNA recombinase